MSIVHIDGKDYRTEDDGVTHLNVYSRAKTSVGRWLSNFEQTPLTLPEGHFESLEGYYHYLKIKQSIEVVRKPMDELPYGMQVSISNLKKAFGKNAQTVGRHARQQLTGLGIRVQNRPTDTFNRAFEHAVALKLEHNKPMHNQLLVHLEDGLPLVHYYVINGQAPHYRKRFDWLCDRIYAVL